MIRAVDVSEHNGVVDYDYLRSQGVEAVIIRAGYGKGLSQIDSQFERNYNSAKKAGLKVGIYWYSYALTTAEAVAEANACLNAIKGKSFDLPVYYDVEEKTQMSRVVTQAIIPAFCAAIENAGYFAGVYASSSHLTNHVTDEVKSRYSLWVAHWVGTKQDSWTTKSNPSPFSAAPVWQWGSMLFKGSEIDTNYIDPDFIQVCRTFYSTVDETGTTSNSPANNVTTQHTLTVAIDGKTVFERKI